MTKPFSADAHSTPDLQTTRTLFPREDAVVRLAAIRGKSGSSGRLRAPNRRACIGRSAAAKKYFFDVRLSPAIPLFSKRA